MPRIQLPFLFIAVLPLQLGFLAAHFILLLFFPKQLLLRDALPLIYLGATYLQWLGVAIFISWRTRVCRVPFLMHLPHLMSFLPLLRHVMLAADKTPADMQSLTFAWLHSVATHIFSLVAAWLWQVRRQAEAHEADLFRKEFLPLSLYGLSVVLTVILYAGLDLSFAATTQPWEVGAIQLTLNLSVTAILLYREHGGLKPLAATAAVIFSLVNAVLLFDRGPGHFAREMSLGVEAALAATSFTQIFSLFVFLIFSRQQKD